MLNIGQSFISILFCIICVASLRRVSVFSRWCRWLLRASLSNLHHNCFACLWAIIFESWTFHNTLFYVAWEHRCVRRKKINIFESVLKILCSIFMIYLFSSLTLLIGMYPHSRTILLHLSLTVKHKFIHFLTTW